MKAYRYLPAIVLCLAFSCGVSAQSYTSAVGLRFGYPLSLSYKTFVNDRAAVEGYIGLRGYSRYRAVSLNAAYLIHTDFPDAKGLQWYYGGGAGVQFWSYDDFGGSTTLGLSGYLGLEYVFPTTPVSISLDWRPTLYLGRNRISSFNNFGVAYGGLGVRYILN